MQSNAMTAKLIKAKNILIIAIEVIFRQIYCLSSLFLEMSSVAEKAEIHKKLEIYHDRARNAEYTVDFRS